ASLCVDRYDFAYANSAIFVDSAECHSIADGICDHERIGPVMQECDIEGRTASSILEGAFAESPVCVYAMNHDAIGIRNIRGDRPELAVYPGHPNDWRTVGI